MRKIYVVVDCADEDNPIFVEIENSDKKPLKYIMKETGIDDFKRIEIDLDNLELDDKD